MLPLSEGEDWVAFPRRRLAVNPEVEIRDGSPLGVSAPIDALEIAILCDFGPEVGKGNVRGGVRLIVSLPSDALGFEDRVCVKLPNTTDGTILPTELGTDVVKDIRSTERLGVPLDTMTSGANVVGITLVVVWPDESMNVDV